MSNTVGKTELPPSSRLSRMKAQFQQKQMQEKEHKLLQMLDSQQQRALQKAAINGVLPSKYSNNGYSSTLSTPGSTSVSSYPVQPGKVRQMFEERRKTGGVLPTNSLYNSSSNGNTTNGTHRNGGIIGIDKSYPLEPLVTPNKSRSSSSKSDPNPTGHATKTTSVRSNGVINKPPANLGTKRGVSLDRSNGTSSERNVAPPPRPTRDSSFTSNGTSRSRAASGQSAHSDINANPVNLGRPLNTTKYADIYGNNESDSLAKREANLAMKMKKMNISGDSYPSSPSPIRSASPPKRSPPPRRKPSRPPAVQTAETKKTAPASKPAAPKGPPPAGMAACKVCGRHFAKDRVEKHESICKKTTTKKRKVFDPTKMRMQGTEAEPYLRKVSAKASRPQPKSDQKPKKDWRKKHEEFIRTIRAAKEYQAHVDAGGNPADLPPPPPTDTSDYVQCPHCGRKFSEGAADRHIPKCQNIRSNKR